MRDTQSVVKERDNIRRKLELVKNRKIELYSGRSALDMCNPTKATRDERHELTGLNKLIDKYMVSINALTFTLNEDFKLDDFSYLLNIYPMLDEFILGNN